MIINHNITALNTYRQLSMVSSTAQKNMARLSSGMRINGAADDAAGLAISEKMRGQIRGLDQANRNAQDGISMLQTAEGALNETHSILNRMAELATQASSDSNTNDDRQSIQSEIQQLIDEIDRIGNTTQFNGIKLIDGSIGARNIAGTNSAAVISSALGAQTAGAVTGAVDFNDGAKKIADLTGDINATIKVDGADISFAVTKAELEAVAYDTTGAKFAELMQSKINTAIDDYNTKLDQNIGHISVTASTNKITFTSGSEGGASSISITAGASANDNLWEIAGMTVAATTSNTGKEGAFSASGSASFNAINATDTSTVTIDGTEITVTWANTGALATVAGDDMSGAGKAADEIQKDINKAIADYNLTVPSDKKLDNVIVSVKDGAFVVQSGSSDTTSSIKFDNSSAAQLLGLKNASSSSQGGGIKFQIGANQGQEIQVTINDMRTAYLGIDKIDLSTHDGATEAITLIQAASIKVSTQRSSLGAFINRLEHTVNNLGTTSENLTTAESRIRDVDMAKEMMEFTKNSILAQAAQAMLEVPAA